MEMRDRYADLTPQEEAALREFDWLDEEPTDTHAAHDHGVVTPVRWSGGEFDRLAPAARRAGQALTEYIRAAVLARLAAETAEPTPRDEASSAVPRGKRDRGPK